MSLQKHGDIRDGALRKVHCASVVGGRLGSTEDKFVLSRLVCLMAFGTRSGLELAPTPWLTVFIATCNKTLARCPDSNLDSSPPAGLVCQGSGGYGGVGTQNLELQYCRSVLELPN
jgi:hypothetical protein